MNRLLFLTAVLVLFLALSPLKAADDLDQIPEGMELIEIGQTKVLVPSGSRVNKKGGLVMLENIDDYMARMVSSLEAKVLSLETRLKGLEDKIEKLTQTIAELNSKNLTSSEKEQP